jgi:hypothetical protein
MPLQLKGIVLAYLASVKRFGGGEQDRTADPLLAKQVLSQLSYAPNIMVGPKGFEPLTPVLSGLCSNQLSYGPVASL